jgi:hypothetical protein
MIVKEIKAKGYTHREGFVALNKEEKERRYKNTLGRGVRVIKNFH